jgi:hypothetical protein
MALIVCRKCGHKVSTTAIKCPGCGTPPHTREDAPEHRPAAPVGPPPQASAPASASGGSALDQIAATARALGLDQLSPRQIAVSVCALLLGWWIFFAIPASPSYAIFTFYRNVQNHDGAAAAGFIDFQTLTKSMTDEAIDAEADEHRDRDPSSEVIGRGLASLMSGAIAETAKAHFERMVDDPTADDKFTLRVSDLVGSIWYLRRKGNLATTRLKDRDGKIIKVTFVRQPDTGWRVSTIGGPGFRKMLREQAEKRAHGGTPFKQLSPDSQPSPDI